jgi:serine/threonine protein kinase
VLPPSVCIVLELCAFGSLSDVVRGNGIDRRQLRASIDGSGSGKPLKTSYTSAPTYKLSTADRLFLAMGCARGLAALHAFSSNLCHRDIKSFNFLVDHQVWICRNELYIFYSNFKLIALA